MLLIKLHTHNKKTTAFLFHHSNSDSETKNISILLLRQKALCYHPFLKRGKSFSYNICNFRRARLKDESQFKSTIDVKVLSDFESIHSLSSENLSTNIKDNSILDVSDIYLNYHSVLKYPISLYHLEKISTRVFSIKGRVKSLRGSDILILEDILDKKYTVPIIITHLNISLVLAISLRPGTIVQINDFYPVYLWDELVAFCGVSISFIEVLEFSATSPTFSSSGDVLCPKPSKFKKKSITYIAWRNVLENDLRKILPNFNSEISDSIFIKLEERLCSSLSIFGLKDYRSPLLEFVDELYIPYQFIRSGEDYSKLNQTLPKVTISIYNNLYFTY